MARWARTGSDFKGFTVVELLIVVVVIAILAAITIVAYNGVQSRTFDTTVQADVATTAKKIEAFIVDNGRLPRTTADLDGLNAQTASNAYASHANAVMYCVDSTGKWSVAGASRSGQRGYYYSSQTSRVIERAFWNAGNPCSDFGVAHNVAGDWAAYKRANLTWAAGGTHTQ